MKSFVNKILSAFDVKLVRKSTHEKLVAAELNFRDYALSEALGSSHRIDFFENLKHSTSQLRQDLFVLSELGFKRDGFFVEFGATNGVSLSNTYLMEKRFGWKGVLAEPAKVWHSELRASRTAQIETDCIWKSTGQILLFNEAFDEKHSGELSTIDFFSDSDAHKNARKDGRRYEVRTISLVDLLNKYNAPRKIDYLSIDTEGSEFEILAAFDFDLFDIKVITCEHNYTPMREKIFELLTRNGYERRLKEHSRFDDWYVRA